MSMLYQILYPWSLCFNLVTFPKEFSLATVPFPYIVHSSLKMLVKNLMGLWSVRSWWKDVYLLREAACPRGEKHNRYLEGSGLWLPLRLGRMMTSSWVSASWGVGGGWWNCTDFGFRQTWMWVIDPSPGQIALTA